MSEVSALWQRIEAWYEAQGALHLLNPGASAEAIAEAEKQLGLSFPAELKESLLRHDGTKYWGWPFGDLSNLQHIMSIDTSLRQSGNESYPYITRNAPSKCLTSFEKAWWIYGWLNIDEDGNGNGFTMDVLSEPSPGQIIFVNREEGKNSIKYDSFKEYLESVLNALQSGKYQYFPGDSSGWKNEGIFLVSELESE